MPDNINPFDGIKKEISNLNIKNKGLDSFLPQGNSDLFELKLKSIALEEIENGIIISKENEIVWINKKAIDLFGYSIDELKGKNIQLIYPLKNGKSLLEKIDGQISKSNIFEDEVICKSKEGTLFTVSQTTLKVDDDNSETPYFITVLEDVTKRKEVEKHLANVEAREEALLKNIPDLVLKCYVNGYIISYHERKNEKFPLPKGDLVKKNITECFPKEFSLRTLFFMERALQTGEVQSFIYEAKDKRKVYYEEARIIPTANDEFIIMIRDMTSRYLADMEIKKNIHQMEADAENLTLMSTKLAESEEKMRELNVNKDKFFSIIAHDLKNPFNALLSFSDMMANQLDELTKEEIADFSSRIYKSANDVYNLLENLLEWSRIQTNRIEHFPVKFNLKSTINEAINLYRSSAVNKNIDIQNLVDEKITITADRNMISAVFRNLISNAIKFTSKNGAIKVVCILKGQNLMISVEDTGNGMSEKTLDSLFKIESSIRELDTEGERGTGLGLILCKEFIEKHGGKIWAESELGKGSNFHILLPK
ncbi:MAG: PAS domain-containing sensor histidine kinase [Melioribacteraceae bacterium]|nr:PAS domain-containing sensor histidine kinase [Melioribacteraceae bacterium]